MEALPVPTGCPVDGLFSDQRIRICCSDRMGCRGKSEIGPLQQIAFHKFQAVSPGIFGKKAASARYGIVIGDFCSTSEESFTQLAEIRNGESRMRLFRRLKRCFDADVNLLLAALEPAAAPRT